MSRLFFLIPFIFTLAACSSTPEIPKDYEEASVKQANELAPLTNKRAKRQPLRLLADTGIRTPETDCQVYSQPNLYSERMETAEAGKRLWTEDTGSAWYRVYKNKKYGYMSKICFTQ